jgi:transposase
MLLAHIASLAKQTGLPRQGDGERARQDATAKRVTNIPGIGVICATAIEALAPAANSLQKGRDFVAWLCLS